MELDGAPELSQTLVEVAKAEQVEDVRPRVVEVVVESLVQIACQADVPPELQVTVADLEEDVRGGVEIACFEAQLELGELRSEVVEALPHLAGSSDLSEILGRTLAHRVLAERRRLDDAIARFADRHSVERVVPVDLVEVVAAGVSASELHVDEPSKHGRAVDRRAKRLEQIVHGDGRHGPRVNGERLHDLLAERVQSVERLADKRLDDVLG